MPMPAGATDSGSAQPPDPGHIEMTDELVKKVADRVYARLLLELRIEQERRRRPREGALIPRGG